MKNSKIKKRKLNIKKVVLLLVCIIVLTGLLILVLSNETSSHVEIRLKTFYVSYGETLWEIARIESIDNEYYKRKDIRNIVSEIKNLNNLENSNLYPGQKLLIPYL